MSNNFSFTQHTLLLTLSGLASRILGFFYRMYLSRTFGAESVGLYQLILPIYVFCYSISISGIETAITQTVASSPHTRRHNHSCQMLRTGLVLTLCFSFLCTLLMQTYAGWISTVLIKEQRCAHLLLILSYIFPLSAVYRCICGYFYGLKKTQVPAFSQVFEQLIKISTVMCLCIFFKKKKLPLTISIAVVGLVVAELIACLYCIAQFKRFTPKQMDQKLTFTSFFQHSKALLSFSAPLTINRFLFQALQTLENVAIPAQLQLCHHSASDALRTYGILNGIALPCILVPTAITNAISTLLLPTIAESNKNDSKNTLHKTIQKSTSLCFLLGFTCTLFFLIFGNFIGNYLFHNKTAGSFIATLAWICPFLYTNNSYLSIINGFGHTQYTLLINTVALCFRMGGVFFAIPKFGICGYLWTFLLSQISTTLLARPYIQKLISNNATSNQNNLS